MTSPEGTAGVTPAEPRTADGLVDPKVVDLVREYARLTGARLEVLEPRLVRLTVCPADVRFFGGRAEHLLALDVESVERRPDAELPVVGGSFWAGLLAATRERGARLVEGCLPVTVTDAADAPDVPLVDAAVASVRRARELRPVVRLVAKLTLSAGTTVEEELVESEVLDVVTGSPVPRAVAEAFTAPPASVSASYTRVDAAPADRLVPAIVRGIEARVAARVEELQERADRELAQELGRIDRYYGSVAKDVRREHGAGSAQLSTVEREHEKRRAEEIDRHRVRVDVQPVQALERLVAAEIATWKLASPAGRSAELEAQRYLTGDGGWGLRCGRCGERPSRITVCRSGHAVGEECSARCSVCGERYCHDHGYAGCAIDGAPVCAEDAEECDACGRPCCTAHLAECRDGGHVACAECVKTCAVCGTTSCTLHGTYTVEGAPRGRRFVCSGCVVYCEGATSEPVGADEAAPCGTCGAHICERHQVRCVADGLPHCSRHLRKTDRSRRFVCEAHHAGCSYEPELIFAPDEVRRCVECGKVACARHAAECHEDGRWHCLTHMAELHDVTGAACAAHRTICHVDGRAYSRAGTAPCEVCGQLACREHTVACRWCGGSVCTKDARDGRCVTCTGLAPDPDPPDEVVAAAASYTGERRVRAWHTARDGGRFVVQLDLGWTRKIVLTVPHGAAAATRAVRHSVLGSARVWRA